MHAIDITILQMRGQCGQCALSLDCPHYCPLRQESSSFSPLQFSTAETFESGVRPVGGAEMTTPYSDFCDE